MSQGRDSGHHFHNHLAFVHENQHGGYLAEEEQLQIREILQNLKPKSSASLKKKTPLDTAVSFSCYLTHRITMNNTTCSPAALARQEDLNYQYKVLTSIFGSIGVFWFAMTVFYILFFYKFPQSVPEPPRGRTRVRASEAGIELGNLGSGVRR
ncbi:hypothetical protein F4782DRAFT_544705 [Xylaria castorea]|nr:hypothetical protein F4782DRAFT_544705 [Xylaria castorea]